MCCSWRTTCVRLTQRSSAGRRTPSRPTPSTLADKEGGQGSACETGFDAGGTLDVVGEDNRHRRRRRYGSMILWWATTTTTSSSENYPGSYCVRWSQCTLPGGLRVSVPNRADRRCGRRDGVALRPTLNGGPLVDDLSYFSMVGCWILLLWRRIYMKLYMELYIYDS